MSSPLPNELNDDRLAREKLYPDERFGSSGERKQAKYYYSVEKMARDYDAAVRKYAAGADVLEYGCGARTVLLDLAPLARTVTGIDVSDIAISKSAALARERDFKNASFRAMNAEALTFPDDSFDLIFGSGIIHHLNIERALRELRRVLRSGGVAIFLESLGHNPIINLYRHLTPSARTADEHPLLRDDFRYFASVFRNVETHHYGLLSLASVPLRNTVLGPLVRDVLVAADDAAFRFAPLRWMSWHVLVELKK